MKATSRVTKIDMPQTPDDFRKVFSADGEVLRRAPANLHGLSADADRARYRRYVDGSCDLTMRGGTTSGVVYPLAVHALAEHYVFRSVGGASAGAIAAAATAAAELGRRDTSERQATPAADPMRVRAGFPGLGDLINWLIGPETGADEWRLAQLFKPSEATRPVFRVLVASMQSVAMTGKSKARCLAVALTAMLRPAALLAVIALVVLWLGGPTLAVMPPASWWAARPAAVVAILVVAVVLVALLLAVLTGGRTAARRVREQAELATKSTMAAAPRSKVGVVLVVLVPLLVALGVLAARYWRQYGDRWWLPGAGWWALAAAAVIAWLVLTLAAAATLAGVFSVAVGRHLTDYAENNNFGLVPGAEHAGEGGWAGTLDRLAGAAPSTGVPAVSTWLADRIDDLAGIPAGGAGQERHALTFGDLWRGRVDVDDRDGLEELSANPRGRAINLELMTTNITQGRPYRLPLPDPEYARRVGGAVFLFCPQCLEPLIPARVVRQMVRAVPAPAAPPAEPAPSAAPAEPAPSAAPAEPAPSAPPASSVLPGQSARPDCPRHKGTPLHLLPPPWDLPVVLAARMSMSLPGLLSAVPLCTLAPAPQVQWFSDGGVTSNFPIHFFDSLLPRWPTFGLNLQLYPPGEEDVPVYLPPQDTTSSTEAWRPVTSMIAFVAAIFDTSLGWRDTMQSALPGFRGRIAHVRQGAGEGGMNLFMRRETIKGLALRGQDAGRELLARFTGADGAGAPDGQTQTGRYRWIRMRLAMRKYAELAREIADGTPLYRDLAMHYHVPADLRGWFEPPEAQWPQPDPHGTRVADAINALGDLAAQGRPLAEQIAGAPPANPNLRLTPRE